ncbi:ead/Ea22-like family protein [Cronobacter turicensis]|uniref:ead/Ea22-like family protein n=1 Tax=Cronobacter turicensis TaxID=413502 RepID=UPI0024AEAA14|nr:ead/Ea22-like family protein [Cronobacter turicensis]MDI7404244.1 ead/Ea22-like family protein [Cronobacter turicensis]
MSNTAKLRAVPRHSVDGYGRQDISYNDPEGEFVFYSDYEALKDALEAAHKRIAELEESHAQVIQARDFYKRANEAAMKSTAKLEASHEKLRDAMAAIHNTIRMDGLNAPLAAIMSRAKRAHEESAAVAGINLETGGE